VPEGEGLEIEKARNEGRTTVAIRVSDAGVAQIARLMIDGKRSMKSRSTERPPQKVGACGAIRQNPLMNG
jgi:hypothetical protein